MQQTKIKIHVSQKSAIAAGRTSYGDQVVTLSDADVAALTPEEREEILHLMTGSHRDNEQTVRLSEIVTDNDGLAGVREALQSLRAKRLEEEAEKARKHRELISAILAAPDEELIDGNGDVRELYSSTYASIPWSDPALAIRRAAIEGTISARKAELRAQAERLLTEMRADASAYPDIELKDCHVGGHLRAYLTQEERSEVDARGRSVDAARKATEIAAEEAQLQRYRDYALTGAAGEAAQLAAAQGYDVRTAVLDAIEAILPETDRTETAHDSPDYEWEERSSPSLSALQLHAQLVTAVPAAQIPAG